MAERVDVAGLGDLHEVLAGAALAIARGAPAGHVALQHEVLDNVWCGAVVHEAELPRQLAELLLGRLAVVAVVGAHVGLGAGTHLAHAHLQQLCAHLRALPRRQDHARVRHRNTDDGNQLFEICVVDHVRRRRGQLRAVSRAHARHTDGVGPGSVLLLQVLTVLQHRQHLKAVVKKAKQRANADIIQAGAHGAVLRQQPVVVVALGARNVHLAERVAMVRLLEQCEGANLVRGLEPAHVGDRQRGDLDVDAADAAARLAARVADDLDRVQELLKRVLGVLAREHQQAAVALALERCHLVAQLFVRQRRALQFLVGSPERAVRAAVHAVVCDVQRREEHNAVAVDAVLDGESRVVDALHELCVAGVHVQQCGALVQCETLHVLRLARRVIGQKGPVLCVLQDFRDRRLVLGGRLGTLHRLENGLLVDDVGGVAVGVALLSLDAPQHPANLLPQRRRPRPPRLHLRRQPVR
mmetsp:Transcript_20294/g.60284  ORF Transcript_20294/g.60284 Transcript_20294/m.60284 type:complete len:469 (-) Transcript_20294:547-1953(-)